EELFNTLKGKLKAEFESGKLKEVLGELNADASLFGQKLKSMTSEQLADRFAKLVIAKAAHGMVERRDRVMSNWAIGLTALQAELRTQKKQFGHITELVTAQFATAVEKLGLQVTGAELELLKIQGEAFEKALAGAVAKLTAPLAAIDPQLTK